MTASLNKKSPICKAQMAELVDALVSGISDASRGGSSPLLGTIYSLAAFNVLQFKNPSNKVVD